MLKEVRLHVFLHFLSTFCTLLHSMQHIPSLSFTPATHSFTFLSSLQFLPSVSLTWQQLQSLEPIPLLSSAVPPFSSSFSCLSSLFLGRLLLPLLCGVDVKILFLRIAHAALILSLSDQNPSFPLFHPATPWSIYLSTPLTPFLRTQH